jgi:NADPH:quinone reductase-like Zn-dependent oxidoreductase
VAEWLGWGLQNLKRRFDPALTPQITMKAIVLNGFGDSSNFKLTELPTPTIKANEVLVQIKAAAFNPIDYQMRKGLRESRLMRSPVLGREFSGIVVATGPDASRFKTGDEVLALAGSMGSNGTYAEYIALNEQLLALKPVNISFEEGGSHSLIWLNSVGMLLQGGHQAGKMFLLPAPQVGWAGFLSSC